MGVQLSPTVDHAVHFDVVAVLIIATFLYSFATVVASPQDRRSRPTELQFSLCLQFFCYLEHIEKEFSHLSTLCLMPLFDTPPLCLLTRRLRCFRTLSPPPYSPQLFSPLFPPQNTKPYFSTQYSDHPQISHLPPILAPIERTPFSYRWAGCHR